MAERAPDPGVEQALVMLDTYNREIEAYSRQLQLLQGILVETQQARDALVGLKEEPGPELLVPLGANTFVHARLAQKETALSGIGAGLSTEKPWDEAIKRLEERVTQVDAEMRRLSEQAVQLQQEAARLQAEIEEEMERVRGANA